MRNVIKAKSAEIFPVVQEILQDESNRVSIIVTGNSMYPFLREGIDSVELMKPDFGRLKKLDIVLIKRKDGVYVLHRVCRKEADCFFMAGDNQVWIEGPLYPEQLIAVVSSVIKNGRKIPSRSYRLLIPAGIWLFLLPLRRFLFKAYNKSRQILKRLLV
jgi:signal peptidase